MAPTKADALRQRLSREELEAFTRLYACSLFLHMSLFEPGWPVPEKLDRALSFTDAGTAWVERLSAGDDVPVSPEQIRLGVFLAFGHREVFVDLAATDVGAVEAALGASLRTRDVRLPWLYGRELHDQYVPLFGYKREDFSAEDTHELLEFTEQGVFQLGRTVVGPLGVLRSLESRFQPPSLEGPAVACSDPGCAGLHTVRLVPHEHPARIVGEGIALGAAQGGPPEAWPDLFMALTGDEERYMDDFHAGMLPTTLAEAFSERELRLVLRELIDRNGALRETWPMEDGNRSLLRGGAQEIVERLGQEACLQLCLGASDKQIVEAIDAAIESDEIVIPATEIRSAVVARSSVSRGWFDVSTEISRHGVRFLPRRHSTAVLRLIRLVRQVYTGERGLEDLDWALRHSTGDTPLDRLRTFAHRAEPREVLRTLLFSSRERLGEALERLGLAMVVGPESRAVEERLLDRITWKLGFFVPARNETMELFWERLGALEEASNISPEPFGERRQEAVRAAGVNLFVSVEELLDYALSFTTWALFTDHYPRGAVSRFVFSLGEARAIMVSHLHGRPLGDEALALDAEGGNTLFPLVEGFRVLATLCQEIRAEEPEARRHSADALPGWAVEDGLFVFPFRHEYPLLDLKPSSVEAIVDALHEGHAALQRTGMLSVRNRLEHKREDFPTADEIRAACAALRDVVELFERTGICPSVYTFDQEQVDRHGRARVHVRDYRDDVVELYRETELTLVEFPAIRVPQLIFHAAQLSESGQSLRFELREQSDYVSMWRDYPYRPGDEEGDDDVGDEAAESEDLGIDDILADLEETGEEVTDLRDAF